MSQGELLSAIESLRSLSLLEYSTTPDGEPHYRVHRLTETFLLNEVLKWQENGGQAQPERELFKLQLGSALDVWQEDDHLSRLNPSEFDSEKEAMIKMIQLGLDHDPFWPLVKKMILILSSYVERRGDWGNWLQTIEKAIEVAKQLGDDSAALEITNLRGRVLQRMSKHVELKQNYRQVIRLAKITGNQIEEARACSNLGFSFIELGRLWRAEVLSQHALNIFNEQNHSHGQAHTNNHIGLLYLNKKNYLLSRDHFDEACRIWREMEDDYNLIKGLSNLGFLYNEMEDPEQAALVLNEALELGKAQGEAGLIANTYLNLGVSHRLMRNTSEALNFTQKAEAIFKEQKDQIGVYLAWENFGHIHQDISDHHKALNYFASAQDGFKNKGMAKDTQRVEEVIRRLQRPGDNLPAE